jgi:hypothetical protein
VLRLASSGPRRSSAQLGRRSAAELLQELKNQPLQAVATQLSKTSSGMALPGCDEAQRATWVFAALWTTRCYGEIAAVERMKKHCVLFPHVLGRTSKLLEWCKRAIYFCATIQLG